MNVVQRFFLFFIIIAPSATLPQRAPEPNVPVYYENLSAETYQHVVAIIDCIEQKIRALGDQRVISQLNKITNGIPLSRALPLYKTPAHIHTQAQFYQNSYSIAINEGWFYLLNTDGQTFWLCHELMHILLEHLYDRAMKIRLLSSKPQEWKQLCIAQEREADLYAIRILDSAAGGLEFIRMMIGQIHDLDAMPDGAEFHPSYKERCTYFMAFNQAQQANLIQA